MYNMTYTSVITSKGTVTIPAAFRKQLGLKEGTRVEFANQDGQLFVRPVISWQEMQTLNQSILRENNSKPEPYNSGDGFKTHVEEKYGKKSIA